MKAYGFTRTYANCRVLRAGHGRKVSIAIWVKNRKAGRRIDPTV
jgi:hypothetical protein